MDVDELNERVAEALEATDLARAEQLLERATDAHIPDEDQPVVVGLWEDLADAYAYRARHDEALAAVRRCMELDLVSDHDLRGTLAAHLLRAGREDEADELWDAAATEQPEEVTLRFMAGVAYQDVDRHSDALEWFDEALELVLQHGDHEGWLVSILQARDEALAETAQQPDDLQKRGEAMLAQQVRQVGGFDPVAQRRLADRPRPVAWFPHDEWQRAVEQWPGLVGDDGYTDYVRQVQRTLLQVAEDAERVVLAPVYVEAYEAWCEAKDLDPSDAATRDGYADEVARLGNEVPWPPRRNDPCWCGSGTKYKKCCQTVASA